MLIDRTIERPRDREIRLPVGKTFAGVGEFDFAIDLAIDGSIAARDAREVNSVALDPLPALNDYRGSGAHDFGNERAAAPFDSRQTATR